MAALDGPLEALVPKDVPQPTKAQKDAPGELPLEQHDEPQACGVERLRDGSRLVSYGC